MKSKLQTEWGFEGIIVDTKLYGAKILIVKDKEATVEGYNKKQDKTFFILQGVLSLDIEGKARILKEGERYRVRPGVRYQLFAPEGDVNILEVGTKIENDFIEV